MKILITNTGPWGTGSFTVAKAVSDELQLMGHQVKIFFPDDGTPCIDLDQYYSQSETYEIWKFPIQKNGVHLSSFPLIIPDPHPRSAQNRTLLDLKQEEYQLYLDLFEEKIKKVIADFQPDIIECQHIWAFDAVIKKLGHPFICVAHHSDQLGFAYDERMRPTALQSARHAEYIFATSNFVKDEVISLYDVDEEKVITLPNGYDRKVFKQLKLCRQEILQKFDLDIPDDAFLISFAGKISRTKGVDILLQANKLLSKKDNVHFLMFGAGNIHQLLTKEELETISCERVHFLGHQRAEVLAEIHNVCDISILPSKSEGFGIACLEAMACGLPMIVTDTGGLGEYAIGEIIDYGCPNKIINVIRKFINMTKDEYHRLSKEAIKTAQKYSWKAITEQRIEYYQQVMEKT